MPFSKRTPRVAAALTRAASLVLSVLCLLGGASREAAAQFIQAGLKLVGTGCSGLPNEGNSVALSADGNTAIVGWPLDNSDAGAAWGAWDRFIRSTFKLDIIRRLPPSQHIARRSSGETSRRQGCRCDELDHDPAWEA